MTEKKRQRIWRDTGWGAYIDRAQHRAGMDAAEIVDNAFAACVACGQSVGKEDLDHGYCTIEDNSNLKYTPCAEKRVYIGDGRCMDDREEGLVIELAGRTVLLPRKAFCKGNTLRKVGDEGTFIIRRWVAQQKGLR